MFWLLAAFVGIPVAVYKFITHYCPEKVNSYLYKSGWNTLELISQCEIYAENTYDAVKEYLPATWLTKKAYVKCIQEGEEVGNYEINEFLVRKANVAAEEAATAAASVSAAAAASATAAATAAAASATAAATAAAAESDEEVPAPDEAVAVVADEQFKTLLKETDFFLYEIPATARDKKYDTYVLRYDNPMDIVEIKEQTDLCPVKFDVIRFEFKNSVRLYNIKFGKQQYIIPGNRLFDRNFLKWYMKTQHNLTLKDEDKYLISFIDQEMNYVSFDEHSYILIKKDSYEQKNTKAFQNKLL
jgi:hypothetical protein